MLNLLKTQKTAVKFLALGLIFAGAVGIVNFQNFEFLTQNSLKVIANRLDQDPQTDKLIELGEKKLAQEGFF